MDSVALDRGDIFCSYNSLAVYYLEAENTGQGDSFFVYYGDSMSVVTDHRGDGMPGQTGKKLYICDRVRRACTVVFLVMAGIWMITGWLKFHIEYMDIKENNNCWARLTQYCHENENDFFFIDVYSSVNFSERMFKTNIHDLGYLL